MVQSKKLTYCWDTNTLLAWLKAEESAPLSDIALVVDEIDANRANLVIPVPVYSEIFESRLNPKQKNDLDRLLQRSNVLSIDLTRPISTKAAEIRDRGHKEKPKRKLRTIDAQVAATAIAVKVTELHALDDHLLHLDGHPTVEGLAIKKPGLASGQKGLLE